jgi:hypothetical protein
MSFNCDSRKSRQRADATHQRKCSLPHIIIVFLRISMHINVMLNSHDRRAEDRSKS